MKILPKILILSGFLVLGFSFAPKFASAFTCHAVAGGGNWNAAGTWENCNSTIPQAQDDVVLDATSGSVVVNVSTNSLKSFDMTGYTGTLSGSSNITVAPSTGSTVTKIDGTITWTGTLNLNPTVTATTTLTTNGKTLLGNVTVAAATGAHVVFADSLTIGSTKTVTLTSGYLHVDGASDNSGLTHTWGSFNSTNSNTRAWYLGTSTIILNGSGGTPFSINNVTGLTIYYGTSTIRLTVTTGFIAYTPTVGSPLEFYNIDFAVVNGAPVLVNVRVWGTLSFSGGGSAATLSNTVASTNLVINNLTFTGTANKTDKLTINSTGGIAITGAMTLAGNSAVNRLLVTSNTLGTPRTITANGTISASNVDFRDITGAGSASWDLSAISGGSGDSLGNTGITFTPAQTNYWVGGTGTWSDSAEWASSSGGVAGTGRVPLPQDDSVFDVNSFTAASQIVTQDMPRMGKNITWTGVTNTPRFNGSISSGHTLYGSLTFTSAMIGPSHTMPLIFEGRGSYTLTSAGLTYDAITVNMVGGTLTLQDAVPTLQHGFTLTTGTFNANNYNVTSNRGFTISGTSARTLLMGSGTWSTGDSFSLGWANTTVTNLTFSADTSTILFSNPGSNNYAFSGGGLRYNKVVFSGTGSGTVTVSGNNYFNKLTINDPRTVKFTSGTTNTISRLEALGELGSTILLQSTTASSIATLSMPGGNTFVGDYLVITDLTATGGAKWYAGANSTLSNSSGWLLEAGPQRRGSFIQDSKVRLEKGKMIIRAR